MLSSREAPSDDRPFCILACSDYGHRVNVEGIATTSIRVSEASSGVIVEALDQRYLPHQVLWERLSTSADVAVAISEMHVRGAPLIGAVAAWGVYFSVAETLKAGLGEAAAREALLQRCEILCKARPTAVNLSWAVERVKKLVLLGTPSEWSLIAQREAKSIMSEDIEQCRQIGLHGKGLIEQLAASKRGDVVNILTHCNAGWLACVDYGTATSPIYQAHDAGIDLHVWVDETRPRNQGAKLTAWELGQHGVPHTIIADNTGGHLMQHGQVDLCIVGSDRVTRAGDIANKIGTYLKALAAKDNNVPFYVAFPSTTIDWTLLDGVKEVPIEERDPCELTSMDGWDGSQVVEVRVTPKNSPALNYGFDVTPARLISGLITERGICSASEEGLTRLFPEREGSAP